MIKLAPILLVEDDPNDVELTLATLAENNLVNEIIIARDGEEAINYLFYHGEFEQRPQGNPIVVLLDLKMPKVDGVEVLRLIKQDPDMKIIPVVILTSSSLDRDLLECYKLGANAYVVKPVISTILSTPSKSWAYSGRSLMSHRQMPVRNKGIINRKFQKLEFHL